MKIILSPAKKMHVRTDDFAVNRLPDHLDRTRTILAWLRERTDEELQKLWQCNDKIAAQNIERLRDMQLEGNLTPAVMSYEGIAYQYMAPAVMEESQLAYLEEHLRILSAFYGVLRPFDGVTPYRLEMQAKAGIAGSKDLYTFWGRQIYEAVRDESGIIVNLASKEYAKCVTPYLQDGDRMLDIIFCEEVKGKLSTKGTYAKMARGEMVRYMAEHQILQVEALRDFDRLDYRFREDLSSETVYTFERVTADNNDNEK